MTPPLPEKGFQANFWPQSLGHQDNSTLDPALLMALWIRAGQGISYLAYQGWILYTYWEKNYELNMEPTPTWKLGFSTNFSKYMFFNGLQTPPSGSTDEILTSYLTINYLSF